MSEVVSHQLSGLRQAQSGRRALLDTDDRILSE